MNNLRRMIHYLGTYKIDAVLGILIVAIETSIELFIPVLMARIIDEGIAHADIPLILHQGALMLACAVTSPALGFSTRVLRRGLRWASERTCVRRSTRRSSATPLETSTITKRRRWSRA